MTSQIQKWTLKRFTAGVPMTTSSKKTCLWHFYSQPRTKKMINWLMYYNLCRYGIPQLWKPCSKRKVFFLFDDCRRKRRIKATFLQRKCRESLQMSVIEIGNFEHLDNISTNECKLSGKNSTVNLRNLNNLNLNNGLVFCFSQFLLLPAPWKITNLFTSNQNWLEIRISLRFIIKALGYDSFFAS